QTHLLARLRQGLALRFSSPAARDLPQALGDPRPRSLNEPDPAAVEKGLDRLFAIRENDQTANRIFQLPHVARPRIVLEPSDRLRLELLLPTILPVELGQKPRRQRPHLLSPLSQWGHPDLYHVKPIVEVLPELAARHGLCQIAIRRGDHARVGGDQPMASHAREPKVLQHMEKLGLQPQGQFGDLVEVDRPFVRVLELPGLTSMGAREGALLVAEELGLEQPLRDRGAVDLDEGPVAAHRCRMDGACDEVLADAAFPANEDGRVRVGDALDYGADGPHPGMAIEKWGATDEVFHILLRQRPFRSRDLTSAHLSPPYFRSFPESRAKSAEGPRVCHLIRYLSRGKFFPSGQVIGWRCKEI